MFSSFRYLRAFFLAIAVAGLVPTLSAQSLEFYVTADSDVAAPGERITYVMTVTNTGSVNLTDVSVLLQRPESITGFVQLGENVSCFGNGTCSWTVGILEPGASRQVGLFTSVRSDASPGVITMNATASATGASDDDESVDVLIEPSSLLRLSLAPGPGRLSRASRLRIRSRTAMSARASPRMPCFKPGCLPARASNRPRAAVSRAGEWSAGIWGPWAWARADRCG